VPGGREGFCAFRTHLISFLPPWLPAFENDIDVYLYGLNINTSEGEETEGKLIFVHFLQDHFIPSVDHLLTIRLESFSRSYR
jgi:hypothetical protein